MIADAKRTPTEYRPTSRAPESFTRKKRSLKLSTQRKRPEGTSGIPNRFISRSRGRSHSKPSCSRRYASSRRYTISVPVKLPTMTPIGPFSSTTTRRMVAPTVSPRLISVAMR